MGCHLSEVWHGIIKDRIMDFHWYPGHMTAAIREIEKNLKLFDAFIGIIDSRFPLSSENPELSALFNGKKKAYVLTKSDIADEGKVLSFINDSKKNGVPAVSVDARSLSDAKKIREMINSLSEEKKERDRKRGIKGRPFRAVVSGVPNVGKSTVINSLKGKASAKTGNIAGVTKGGQWLNCGGGIELFDTPGLLPKKISDKRAGLLLAFFGSMNDELFLPEELFAEGFLLIRDACPGIIESYSMIDETKEPYSFLEEYAGRKGLLKKGNEPDTKRAAMLFINDMRSGKAGRLFLDEVNDLKG
ncbi:MAG: ribosome biogenesis GTPase YlqF [Lachnospiraceae bacterium]|nr:ribosome biogenesis GTPase YlqF [Lachnospiraceae bacterium]